MERRNSLVQQFIVALLPVCMNISVANGAASRSQAGSPFATMAEQQRLSH
jgi:hypothetical protein